ncbi:hypothetical protein M9458_011257, partial [Cirrhinus mrigala]
PFINQQTRTRKRDTCIKVMVAVILLGIVFGFVIYEWNGYWPGVEERQDLSGHQGANKTHKIYEEDEGHDHDQHHHHDDGDHNDHDHKDGDDHHDHHDDDHHEHDHDHHDDHTHEH